MTSRADQLSRDEMRIGGVAPGEVLSPRAEEEWTEAIRLLRAAGGATVPVGGGTALRQGNPLACKEWTALSTSGTAGIREYSADDMVVTAGAGTTLAELQEEVGRHRQFVPLDAPDPDRATLGGVVATNSQGLWRPGYGLPRDRLLGVRVALADGTVVKGGGKVVKNVAGYDLCKLFAGSWGTLGVITEVTFKTNPIPASRAHLCYEGADLAAVLQAAHRVHTAQLDPAYLAAVAQEGTVRLCVGLHGSEKATCWQAGAVESVLIEGGLRPCDNGPSEDELRHVVPASPAPIKARITVRPSDLAVLAPRVAASASICVIHAQTGAIEVGFDEMGEAAFGALRRELEGFVGDRGHLISTALPAEMLAGIDVWGRTRPEVAMMRKVKHALDPHGLFSPGRFIGRI